MARVERYSAMSSDVHQPDLQLSDGEHNLLIIPTEQNVFEVVFMNLPMTRKKFLGIHYGNSQENIIFKSVEKKELVKFVNAFYDKDFEFFRNKESELW